MRAVIYARYSSDRQRETSIEDQLRVCRALAARHEWRIEAIHRDEEISGSTPVGARPGGNALLADALADRFDALILEGLDRLSRDLVEQEKIVRRLEHRGIRIVGVSDGYDSSAAGKKLHRGMRGLINEIYLDDLRHKTHRGQSGQVSRGYSAGGGGYGYKSEHDGRGYRMAINEEQAEWVRFIFDKFAAGWSVQKIAFELNRLRIPSPRGGTWAVSALYGSPAKGSGILNNELYGGRYIWNRSQWVKDPDTGKRQRTERPKEEWQIEEREDLRIVDAVTWEKVRARFKRNRIEGGTRGSGAAVRTLLGGLMTCGYCGGAIVANNARLYGCAARKDRGPDVCRGVLAPRAETDKKIIGTLRDIVLDKNFVGVVHELLDDIVNEAEHASAQNDKAKCSRIGELESEVQRIVDAIAAVGISGALKERLQHAEEELSSLRSARAAIAIPKAEVKNFKKRYAEEVLNLQDALSGDIVRARAALRDVLHTITITEDAEKYVWAKIKTDQRVLLKAAGLSLEVVAGARFELTTFGL